MTHPRDPSPAPTIIDTMRLFMKRKGRLMAPAGHQTASTRVLSRCWMWGFVPTGCWLPVYRTLQEP